LCSALSNCNSRNRNLVTRSRTGSRFKFNHRSSGKNHSEVLQRTTCTSNRDKVFLAVLLGTGTVMLSQERAGSVSGTVIDSHTQAPINGVRIEIPGVGQSTTEESGRFRITNIPQGRYLLQAVQSGMTADPEDRSSWWGVVAPDGETGDVRLRMSRFSVICGHVLDDRGKPASGVSVQAMVLSYPQGRECHRASSPVFEKRLAAMFWAIPSPNGRGWPAPAGWVRGTTKFSSMVLVFVPLTRPRIA
jgi:hypothetical protein